MWIILPSYIALYFYKAGVLAQPHTNRFTVPHPPSLRKQRLFAYCQEFYFIATHHQNMKTSSQNEKAGRCTEYGSCSQHAKIIEVQVCRKTRYILLHMYLEKHTHFTSSSGWNFQAISDNSGDSIVQNGKNYVQFLCLTQGLRLRTFRWMRKNSGSSVTQELLLCQFVSLKNKVSFL